MSTALWVGNLPASIRCADVAQFFQGCLEVGSSAEPLVTHGLDALAWLLVSYHMSLFSRSRGSSLLLGRLCRNTGSERLDMCPLARQDVCGLARRQMCGLARPCAALRCLGVLLSVSPFRRFTRSILVPVPV